MMLKRKNIIMTMIILVLPVSASAVNAATVSIGNATVLPNGNVTLPIMINNVTDVGSIQITLKYDKNVAHVTNIIAGNFDSTIQNINNTTGITTIAAFQIINMGLNGDARLANITLMAVGSERASTPLNITITTLKTATPPLQNIIATTVNGTFTIIDLTPPAGISNLTNTTESHWINWTWNNPADPDFNHTMIYINGTWVMNTSEGFYNATFSPHTTRTISTHTVDTSGNTNTTWVNQTTKIPNNIPVISPIGNQTINENQTLFIDVNATDIDGDTLKYSTNKTDLFTDFNTTTGRGNWTPSYTQAGVYYVNFGASDGYGGIVNETVQITVNNVNRPPSISQVVADKILVAKNDIFTVTVAAFDPDADNLTYQFDWENNGTWSPNQSSNNTTTHAYSTVGSYRINVLVWDSYGANATNDSLVITVREEIIPPNVTNPQAVPAGVLLEEASNKDYQHMTTKLNVTVTDASAVNVTINLSSIGGGAAAVMNLTGGNIYSITTNATGTPGNKSLRVNATDIHGNSNTNVVVSLKVSANGDVNSDGVTDIADAMWLAKNRIGTPGYPINELASEVNGDNMIDISDAMYIAKHVLGIQGFENIY